MGVLIEHEVGSTVLCRRTHAPCSNCGGCLRKYNASRGLCAKCAPPSATLDPRFDAVREPTAEEVAWAAGIYEGEGSCSLIRRTVQIRVPQKDPELLYRLAEMFGGNVRLRSPNTETGRKECWVWDIHGARARKFVELTRPWLTARRIEQIDKVFS